MKKLRNTLCAFAGALICLSVTAGNYPNRVPLGQEPALLKKRISSSFMRMDYDDEQARMVVKMNISQLVLKNISLQYEYGFHKNMSGALGISFLMKRDAPEFFTEEDPTGEGLRNTALKGFAITPEFRFYPGAKEEHQAPHGFYIGAYYRYSKHTITSTHTENFSNGKTYSYNMEASYKGANAGLMIGSQWIIGKHFSIDWWILGGGAGKAKFQMEATGAGFIMNSQERAEVKESVEQELADVAVLGFKTEVTTTGNSVKAAVNGLPMLSFRGFGICLGFAF